MPSTNEKHYNPAVAARLRTLVDGRQWSSLPAYLGGLSNAQFRTAGYMMGEVFMPKLPDDDFWTVATVLTEYNAKAFLVTVLKSWTVRQQTLDEVPSFFESLRGRSEDIRKALNVLLPVLRTPAEVEQLLQAMAVSDPQLRIHAFMQNLTPVTAYLLLKALHEVEDDRALLVRITCHLMKQGGNLSFNLASLLKAFFALDEVKGTFSLSLQPYQLARLLGDYEAFKKAVMM